MEEQNNNGHGSLWSQIRHFLNEKFNLDDDRATEEEVRKNIRKSVEFKGPNLWILIFAILVASVGLNVNSTAIIIGAMLISPLMGPIMGIGLSLGINDFDLFKRSAKNFLFAMAVSILTSTIYFLLSPLSIAQSELLARTSPTIWDVLIATFGGFAGIIAQSRQDRTSTVIPGVAIATTLLPPLCTAGYGLATGNIEYFVGAFYLFFINAVFIAFTTFFVVRFLRYDRVQFLDPKRAKRVKQYMVIIIVATLVPSVFMAYGMVQKAIWDNNSKLFVDRAFDFEKCQIVNTVYEYDRKNGHSIDVMLMGEPLSEDMIAALRGQLPEYYLHNTKLFIRQATSHDSFDTEAMQNILISNAEIIAEKNRRIAQLEYEMEALARDTLPATEINRELAALWSGLDRFSVSRTMVTSLPDRTTDTILLCVIRTKRGAPLPEEEAERLTKWLKVRSGIDNIKLLVEPKESSE